MNVVVPNTSANIEARLAKLESIDTNSDGKISEEEFQIWFNKFMEKESLEVQEMRQENQLLRNQLKKTKELIATMQIPHSEKTPQQKKLDLLQLSQARVDEFVQTLLDDPSVNIWVMPDRIERQLYTNMFNIMLRVLSHVVDESSMSMIGHKLSLSLDPVDAPEKSSN